MSTIPGLEVTELVSVPARSVIPGLEVSELVADIDQSRPVTSTLSYAAKAIPLEAVRNALMCAVLKQKVKGHEAGGSPHCRTAAYTYYAPLSSVTCRTACPGQQRRQFSGMNFGVMERGDFDRLLERVRLLHGLSEVRSTWNLGLRALRAEIGHGVMR